MNDVGLLLKKPKRVELRFKPFFGTRFLEKNIDDIVDEHDFVG